MRAVSGPPSSRSRQSLRRHGLTRIYSREIFSAFQIALAFAHLAPIPTWSAGAPTTPNGFMKHRTPLVLAALSLTVVSAPLAAQQGDSTRTRADSARPDSSATTARLAPVHVTAAQPLHVIGHLPAVRDGVIYSGKKTEVLLMDSLRANTAQDVERQILGRIPGANFSETEGAGFPSNGVGFRGLDPTQSQEMNTRQNGVNIAGDVFGYPETYYAPPSEALERIEIVRGAGALAFGPQFGGTINYVVRRGRPHSAPAVTLRQTAGSWGLINSFDAVGGGTGSVTYYGFLDARRADGWRPNSDYRQATAYGSATWTPSRRLTMGLQGTLFRNRIHMPGGLSDAQFAADPGRSYRARNWLASPWNILAATARWDASPTTRLETVLSYMAADRHLVWRNEDGGPAAADSIDPATGTYVPREVERETFHDLAMEARLRSLHVVHGIPMTLAAGLRAGLGDMRRFEGGPGSTGSDFDMTLHGGTWERALRFRTTNLAAFAEDLVRLGDRLSVTPGARLEYVRSQAAGYTDVTSRFAPKRYAFPLLGIGAEYETTRSTTLYANVTQAYRPITYSALTPVGSIARVDPALHAARGYNADLGWRGTLADAVKVDASIFYLLYRGHIGTRTVDDGNGGTIEERANIGTSVHRGVEAYLEIDPLRLAGAPAGLGSLDLFTSSALIDARYVTGEFADNRVEQAPRLLSRVGATYALGALSTTVQVSYTGLSYGDANNSVLPTDDAAAGLVPAYTVADWSARLTLGGGLAVDAGMNNLTNVRYYTKRTDEYPGPGILPGMARSAYAGLSLAF